MKPLFIKKNGTVQKVSGIGMPSTYPAERVAYDNTTSGLSADDTQGAIDEIVSDLDDKVDKETGKGLSTNDFTNEDKALIGQTLGNNTVLTTDKTPFLTRQTLNPTGFSGYVREKLVGASYAWNNAVKSTTSGTSRTVTFTNNGDGSYTVNGTATVGSDAYFILTRDVFPQDHVIFFNGCPNGGSTTTYYIHNGNSTVFDTGSGALLKLTNTGWGPVIVVKSGVTVNNLKFKPQWIDLTLAFGSTIADYLYNLSDNGGITKLRDMGFPIDKYTPYGYGLYSVKTSGKKIVGNISKRGLDNCSINNVGKIESYTNVYLLLAKVSQNKTYSFECDVSGVNKGMAFYYDEPVIGSVSYNNSRDIFSDATKEFTSPINGYVAFSLTSAMLESAKINGALTVYSLGNDELRGKFDLVNGEIVASGDVKESNGEITRNWHEKYNLGNLTWAYESTYQFFYHLVNSSSPITGMKLNSAFVCDKYAYNGYKADADMANAGKGIYSHGTYIYIKDTAYTDATTFKTSLDGTYVQYELTTPTTEQSTPFADPMSLVGATTEEYIDTRDIPCPVGAERQYMGQSEDIIPIPSAPHSDGVWVYKCYVSSGKAQYVWELEESDE